MKAKKVLTSLLFGVMLFGSHFQQLDASEIVAYLGKWVNNTSGSGGHCMNNDDRGCLAIGVDDAVLHINIPN